MAKAPAPVVDTTWMLPGALTWVELEKPTEDAAFLKGKLLSKDDKEAEVQVEANKMKLKLQLLQERVDQGGEEGFSDMVNMEVLNDAELLENVRKRFMADNIMTYVGPTLIVVNPFKGMPNNVGAEVRKKYIDHIIRAKKNYKDLPPSVYALAAEAFRCLFDANKNQAIVISGESGAGKTENAKFAMSLLTSIGDKPAQTDEIPIEVKILNCNPILEAFGNSKTVKNNNSSRFGKYVRMMVDRNDGSIKGAEILNYLLEKSRINVQAVSERNFHIFYHFYEGNTVEQLKSYHMVQKDGTKIPYEWFEFLKPAKNYTSPGIDDKALFDEIREAIDSLGMKDDYEYIFRLVAGVLLMGNLVFDGSTYGNETACSFVDRELLDSIADLLSLETKALEFALSFKQRKIGAQIINSPLTLKECEGSREALAKEIYYRLFDWLVLKLNETIQPQSNGDYLCFGLLDIYGFEVFEVNSFGQLMINYTNEKLHQLYISYVFKEEENLFKNEGLERFWKTVQFHDNKPVIDLIDGHPTGIFSMLDESCSIQSQTDENLLTKMRNTHKNTPVYKNPKIISNPTFVIIHTAKNVEYNILTFRAQNMDETSVLVLESMSTSKNPLLSSMFKGVAKGDKFLASKMKKSMNSLMQELNACDVHFIRCLKPNELKKKNVFHADMTLNQIRYLGVLDSLKVRKESFPIRKSFEAFYKQFQLMIDGNPGESMFEKVTYLQKNYFKDIPEVNFVLGKTKVFLRTQGQQACMDIYNERMKMKSLKASKIQKAYKCMKFKRGVKKHMAFIAKLKKQMKHLIGVQRLKKYIKYVLKIQKWIIRIVRVQKIKAKLQTTKQIEKYVKRYQYVKQFNKIRKSILVLQKWVKKLVREKEKRKQQMIKFELKRAIDAAWLIIINKKAIIIQKVFRGHRVRISQKSNIETIKEAGVQVKIRNNATLIQKYMRGYLVRLRIKKMHRAAQKIQGYFKMTLLSELFQRMRRAVRQIQPFIRMFIRKKSYLMEKYQKYVQPWEMQMQQIKADEDAGLFHIDDLLVRDMEYQAHIDKMQLFAIVIDLEFLSDPSEVYEIPWTQTYREFLSSQFSKQLPVQMIETGENFTVGVSASGKQYSWGEQNFDIQEKIKLFSLGENHALFLNHEGELFENNKVDPVLTKVTYAKAINNSNFAITENGDFYVWPLEKKKRPTFIQAGVSQISCGNQFAILLMKNGQIWSFGENLEGELGLGDNILRTDPCQIDLSDRISQVECGFKHVIAKASMGKIYTWGWGERGQLGNGSYANQTAPKMVNVNYKVLQIAAGHKCSILLTDSHKIYWTGSNRSISYQTSFQECRMQSKSVHLASLNYMPVRIHCSWSRMSALIQVTFATLKQNLQKNVPLKFKILNLLTSKWVEQCIKYVDPPNTEQLANYICEKHMKKPTPKQKLNLQSPKATSTHHKLFSSAQKTPKLSIKKVTVHSDKPKRLQTLPVNEEEKHYNVQVDSMRSSEHQSFAFPNTQPGPNKYLLQTYIQNSVSKLKEIKERLKHLKTIPETKWGHDDIEFIKQIYQSNLSQLLKSL